MEKNSAKILWLAIFIYTVTLTLLSLKKFYNFDYNAFDLAIFSQVFYNTLHGRWFEMTINLHNYLGDHFIPAIFLFIPVYALKPGPEILLFLQSLGLSLCAWPIYYIAKKVLKKKMWALGISILWLLNPFVHVVNLFEFHMMSLSLFFILWTFYFYQKKSFKAFVLFLIISLLFREDVSFVVLMFGVLSIMDRRSIKWVLTGFLVPVSYFAMAISIVQQFSVSGSYPFYIYYGWLGGTDLKTIVLQWVTHPLQVLGHLFSIKNISHTLIVFLPFLFVPFFAARYLVLGLIIYLEFALSSSGFNSIIYTTHYIGFLLPVVFLAMIFGFEKLMFMGQGKLISLVRKEKAIFLGALIITVIYFLGFLSPVMSTLFHKYDKQATLAKENIVNLFSQDSSLAVGAEFAPMLSNREVVYTTNYAYFGKGQFAREEFDLPKVDYIFIDGQAFLSNINETYTNPLFAVYRQEIPEQWRNKMSGYSLVEVDRHLILWQDSSKAEIALPIWDFVDSTESRNNFYQTHQLEDNKLKIEFKKFYSEEQNYIIRFDSISDHYYFPLDYTMYPEWQWPEDKNIVFYYYIPDDVVSFQIFKWDGEHGINRRQSIDFRLTKDPITDLIQIRDK